MTFQPTSVEIKIFFIRHNRQFKLSQQEKKVLICRYKQNCTLARGANRTSPRQPTRILPPHKRKSLVGSTAFHSPLLLTATWLALQQTTYYSDIIIITIAIFS